MARRWKVFHCFREEEVTGKDDESELRPVGLRLANLLRRDGEEVSAKTCAGGGWIGVVNRSTKQIELFEERLKQYVTLKAHTDSTGAIFLSAQGTLWSVGWDSSAGRDSQAPSSVHCYSRGTKRDPVGGIDWEVEKSFSLGRRREASCLSVGFGYAVVGFTGGEVLLISVEADGGRPKAVRLAGNGSDRGDQEILVVSMLAKGVAVVATSRNVQLVRHNGNQDSSLTAEEVDGTGCAQASAASVVNGELAIARENAISFYSQEGLGACLAMAAPLAMTAAAGPHLFVLSSTARRTELVAYDLATRLISHREDRGLTTVGSGVVGLFGVEEHAVVVVRRDGQVVRLQEISSESRVEELLQRKLFSAAIQIARRDASEKVLERAVQLYASDLVSRGEFDAAAQQVVAVTNENSDTSWAVMLLAEQPGTRTALIKYLKALLAKGLTTTKHIRLLVACYNDSGSLLRGDPNSRLPPPAERSDDPDTERPRTAPAPPPPPKAGKGRLLPTSLAGVMRNASKENIAQLIEACRAAGLYEAAEVLAREHQLPVLLAQILAEDRFDSAAVLDLIATSTREDALSIAIAVGRWLRNEAPRDFLEAVLKSVFNRTAAAAAAAAAKAPRDDPGEEATTSGPPSAELIVRAVESLGDNVFMDSPELHASLLETAIEYLATTPSSEDNGSSQRNDAELTQRLWDRLVEVSIVADVVAASATERLVSTGAADPGGAPASVSKTPGARSRIGRLLQTSRGKIDLQQVGRLAEMYGHNACLRMVQSMTHDYEGLARQLRHEGDLAALMTACQRHGDRAPGMWLQLIRLVAEEEDDDAQSIEALERAFNSASQGGPYSALEVIDLFCRAGPAKPLSIVWPFFKAVMSALDRSIEAEEAAVTKLRTEIAAMDEESHRLATGPTIVQLGSCEVCDAPSTLPAVYFLCGHTFHARCLTTNECFTCASTTRGIAEVRHALDVEKENHDAYFRDLEVDGYDAVLRHLQRSIL